MIYCEPDVGLGAVIHKDTHEVHSLPYKMLNLYTFCCDMRSVD